MGSQEAEMKIFKSKKPFEIGMQDAIVAALLVDIAVIWLFVEH